MLILSRRENESIIIDDNIEVKILGIENGRVRLGIEAPKNIEILRKELYTEVEDENKAAVNKTMSLDDFKGLFKRKKK